MAAGVHRGFLDYLHRLLAEAAAVGSLLVEEGCNTTGDVEMTERLCDARRTQHTAALMTAGKVGMAQAGLLGCVVAAESGMSAAAEADSKHPVASSSAENFVADAARRRSGV